ncbi:LOW QUALITY PROTEIN: hypothetical protein PHMEG_00010132 [Phytophthora megakarya]|uniref:Reverse transcriptase domain-containing protein n=1 Tax=Phytophthora megakarya TaxID=4795 RepID=A0A225WET3_9STRA|nr:LOW QUALITY PROTEIN: hypothetical protein PHMEG_00010132 [Phytophthora megakarya]
MDGNAANSPSYVGYESRICDKLPKLGEITESVISVQLVEAASRLYDADAKLIRVKMLVRGSKCRRCRKDTVPSRRLKPVKRVHFDQLSLFAERSEEFYDSNFERDKKCDLYDYVYVVHDNAAVKQTVSTRVVSVANDASGSDDDFVAEGLRVIGSANGIEALSGGHIDCTPVGLLIDSGVVASLIDVRILKRIGRADTPLRPCSGSLNGVTGLKIEAGGVVDLPLHLGSLELIEPFVVVGRLHVDAILGTDDLKAFRAHFDSDVYQRSVPVRISTGGELQLYLSLGHIRPSISPWASPALMIRNPDGGIRFCIDYRQRNAVTVKDCYSMSLIDNIIDVLGNAKPFSTMDIASGYWNVPMAADSIDKTAFTFQLCNAVIAFEHLMEYMLIDLTWRACLVYLDDCVVFSLDFPSHTMRLKQVLERFRKADVKLKMKKCKLGGDQGAFLGHIVTPSGILPNPEKSKR